MSDHLHSSRSQLRRLPSRGFYDRTAVNDILDAHYLCHVAICASEGPLCIPTAYGRKGDVLFLHGSVKSRLLEELAAGNEACISVVLTDAIVLARSVFHSSMNYRSVVLFGKGQEVTDPSEKLEALRVVTESIWQGRWQEARRPNQEELKATRVVAFPIHEGSAKVRTGPPKDNSEDYALGIWAGIVPVRTIYDQPVADPAMTHSLDLPGSVKRKIR